MHSRGLSADLAFFVAAILFCPPAFAQANESSAAVQFHVMALPGLQRHLELLARPGYVAIVLENNGLAPTQSSRIIVEDRGRAARIRSAAVRFVRKQGALYVYEATYSLGLGESQISFPVTVDVSAVPAGRVTVAVSPPLARLIPAALVERIRLKTELVASGGTQQKILDYLDAKSQQADPMEAVLLDAYNRGQGPAAAAPRDDTGAAISDTWLLLLTCAIWLGAVLAYFFLARRRRAGRPAT